MTASRRPCLLTLQIHLFNTRRFSNLMDKSTRRTGSERISTRPVLFKGMTAFLSLLCEAEVPPDSRQAAFATQTPRRAAYIKPPDLNKMHPNIRLSKSLLSARICLTCMSKLSSTDRCSLSSQQTFTYRSQTLVTSALPRPNSGSTPPVRARSSASRTSRIRNNSKSEARNATTYLSALA